VRHLLPWVPVTTLFVIIAMVFAVTAESNEPTLSDRINEACSKPGYVLQDWLSGNEYKTVPEGTVEVTCQQAVSPFRTYKVAVER
jgi:hypothetical protein